MENEQQLELGLGFDPDLFMGCRYEVVPKTKKCLEDIDKFIKEKHRNESGIIYCLSRSDCEKVAEKLRVRLTNFLKVAG
jgi:superfamily II DNA helicase RecQ